jgi:hypothetical protein
MPIASCLSYRRIYRTRTERQTREGGFAMFWKTSRGDEEQGTGEQYWDVFNH